MIERSRSQLDKLTNAEILNYAINSGMLDVAYVQDKIIMQKNEEILKNHPYKIWEGKDGKWRTYFPDTVKGRKLVKRNTEEAINNAVVSFYKDSNEKITIREVYKQWIERKLEFRDICKGTMDRCNNNFDKFFIGSEIDGIPFSSITDDMLETFIKRCIVKYDLTAKSFAGIKTIINGMFKYAAKKLKCTDIIIAQFFGELELSNNIFRKVKKSAEKQVFREDEVPKVVEYLNSNPTIENLAVLFQFETGLRVGELAAIKKSDISGSRIHVQRTEIKFKDKNTNKTVVSIKEFPKSEAGDRYVILSDSAIDTIKRIESLNEEGDYLFMKNGNRIKSRNINKRITYACKKLNITVRSSHKVRKTYGTMLIDAKVDESLIISQMGHNDIETTKDYYYFSNKTLEKQRDQISSAIDF